MTPMPLGLFIKKLQPKVGLAGYAIFFAHFVVEAKSKTTDILIKWIICFLPTLLKVFFRQNSYNVIGVDCLKGFPEAK